MEPVSRQQAFRAARRDPRLAVLEGFHAIKHALRFGARLQAAYAVDVDALERLAAQLAPDLSGRFAQLCEPIDPSALRQLVPRAPRTGVVALARRPDVDVAEVLGDARGEPVVMLDDPRDLANVGAVVRVAAAADAAGVLTTGIHDPWDAAALRGSAGLHYAVPVARVDRLPASGRPIVAVHPGASEPIRTDAVPDRAILVFGTERHGLGAELRERADACVALPMRAGVSSLNLATCVAGVLFARRLAAPAGARPGS